MNLFAERMISLFEKAGVVLHHPRNSYVYGLDLLLYTILSTIGLIVIGISADRSMETFLLIVIFYITQSTGGGFHASSHLKCFCTMAIGLIIYLFSFKVSLFFLAYIIIAIFSLSILYIFPLILNKNKLYLDTKHTQLIHNSHLISLLEAAFFIAICFIKNLIMIHSVSFAFLLCACSRIAAILFKQGKCYFTNPLKP